MASAGPIPLELKLASVWSGVMPQSEMPLSLAMLTSIVADSVSKSFLRMSVTVSEGVTLRALAIEVIPSVV